MAFAPVLDSIDPKKLVQIGKAPSKTKQLSNRGCKHCPSNDTKGVNKLKEKIKSRKLLIVGMAPGRDENIQEKNLVGGAGKFLWSELAQYGIKRSDADTMNVVRCFPADRVDGQLVQRDPSKEEYHCCSLYTDKTIEKSAAKVYIVLGEKAAKQFLGKEYKKTRKIFWSEKLQAKVYCLYHPSYFARGMFPQVHLDDFRKGLEAAAADLGTKQKHSRTSYLEAQNYLGITTVSEAHTRAAILRKAAIEKGVRLAVDSEDDDLGQGRFNLCVGFSYKPGQADVFITEHPLARKVKGKWRPLKKSVQRKIKAIVSDLLADPKIHKVMHHGSSDQSAFKQQLGVSVKGYDYDTEYAEYLADPDRRAFGLASIATARFPQFGEYKTITVPYRLPKDFDYEAAKIEPTDYGKMLDATKSIEGGGHLSQMPLKMLVLYNGADCDITKRIELSTKKKVSLPLLRIYKDAAFILGKMEPNGPAFDYEHCLKLRKLYPTKLEIVYDKLKQIAGKTYKGSKFNKKTGETVEKVFWDNSTEKTEFNPASSDQVKSLLFSKLRLTPPSTAFDKKKKGIVEKEGKYYWKNKKGEYEEVSPGTGKKVLELLLRKHEVAQLLIEYRKLAKIESTYLDSYEQCAKANGGRLRTKWWLTGTRTGRLSSGGGKLEDADGNLKVVNLQNIHGDPNLKNQVVADPAWRKLYAAVQKAIKQSVGHKELDEIRKLQGLIAAIPQYAKSAKEKKKLIEAQLFGDTGVVTKLNKRLEKSSRFKKLCKRIVRRLGDIAVLLGFDQGQVEVRVMAQASGDKNLIRDCMSGDIHSMVGHAMTGWPIEDIKKDKKTRTLTKNIHFGILFGLGVAGLYDFIKAKDPDTDITEERAQELYNNYFKAYPGVAKFIQKMRAFVEEHGFVENMFGFKRPLGASGGNSSEMEDDFSESAMSEGTAFWGNQAINTPIQGAAHCLMLMAMAIMKRNPKKYGKLVPTLEIHDYMGFKVPLRAIFETFKLGKNLLEKEPLKLIKKEYPEIDWKIPLMVEGKVGFRLGDDVEADGKSMPQLLTEMFLESYQKECRLDADLALVA